MTSGIPLAALTMEPEDLSMERSTSGMRLLSLAGSDPETSGTPSVPAPENICPSSDPETSGTPSVPPPENICPSGDNNNNRRVKKPLFPDNILYRIFDYLSFGDQMNCAQVCRQWRKALSAYAYRWRSLTVGLNCNLHGSVSSESVSRWRE